MKIIINEYQFEKLKDIIKEMAYPSSFNFDEFRECRSFAERVRYCEARLQRIASGSSRIVYQVDNEKVLKLAKNQKGIAQNQVEYRLGTEPYYSCFAEIYEYDENGLWIEMELCRKAKKSDFKVIYGVPFEVLCCMIYDQANNFKNVGWKINPYGEYGEIVQQIWDGEENDLQLLFTSVQEYIESEMLESVGDLCRLSSWGINSEGYFTLIDFGLDDDVAKNYYGRR